MKIRNNLILRLGRICLVLEVIRGFYYTDSTLDAASYFCMSTFIFLVSDLFFRLKKQSEEEHRDINVPMTEDIEDNVLDDIFFIFLIAYIFFNHNH